MVVNMKALIDSDGSFKRQKIFEKKMDKLYAKLERKGVVSSRCTTANVKLKNEMDKLYKHECNQYPHTPKKIKEYNRRRNKVYEKIRADYPECNI